MLQNGQFPRHQKASYTFPENVSSDFLSASSNVPVCILPGTAQTYLLSLYCKGPILLFPYSKSFVPP